MHANQEQKFDDEVTLLELANLARDGYLALDDFEYSRQSSTLHGTLLIADESLCYFRRRWLFWLKYVPMRRWNLVVNNVTSYDVLGAPSVTRFHLIGDIEWRNGALHVLTYDGVEVLVAATRLCGRIVSTEQIDYSRSTRSVHLRGPQEAGQCLSTPPAS